MQRPVLITIAVLLGGCATVRPQPQPRPSDATLAAHGVKCHKERATGSLVAAAVCTSAADRARQAADAQQTKDWLNNDKSGPCPKYMDCH